MLKPSTAKEVVHTDDIAVSRGSYAFEAHYLETNVETMLGELQLPGPDVLEIVRGRKLGDMLGELLQRRMQLMTEQNLLLTHLTNTVRALSAAGKESAAQEIALKMDEVARSGSGLYEDVNALRALVRGEE